MADEGAADSRLIDLEIEKRRLECEKLRAEIAEVGQPLWKRAGYIASLSPIILATVAFLSAWVTGYFDRQKQVLESEIGVLEARRAELEARNDAIQAGIDDAYLRLKAVAGEARYALGHIRGLDDGGRTDAALQELLGRSAAGDAAVLEAVVERNALIRDLVGITEAELGKLQGSLDDVPASDWARSLQYMPGPEAEVLTAPDGRRYHLGERRFLDEGTTGDHPAGPGTASPG